MLSYYVHYYLILHLFYNKFYYCTSKYCVMSQITLTLQDTYQVKKSEKSASKQSVDAGSESSSSSGSDKSQKSSSSSKSSSEESKKSKEREGTYRKTNSPEYEVTSKIVILQNKLKL